VSNIMHVCQLNKAISLENQRNDKFNLSKFLGSILRSHCQVQEKFGWV
jgi:hypothetical protein